MSTENVALIRSMYDAFAAGDVPAVVASMSPDIEWIEAESNPWADGNPYVGPQAVVEGIFARCADEFDGFSVQVGELIDAGDTIVMLGRYGGTCKATGRAQNPQVVHVWRISGGKVVKFQQFLDTLHFAQVKGLVDAGP